MSNTMFGIAIPLILVLFDTCDCDSQTVRVLGKPNIRPLYLNVSESSDAKTKTAYGRFHCPPDTQLRIFGGTIVTFDKVSKSNGINTLCELVVYYESWWSQPILSLESESVSEDLAIHLNGSVSNGEQTEFSGTDCLVGIKRSSEKQSTTYTAVIQNCDPNLPIESTFYIWLEKYSGTVFYLPSDPYCYDSDTTNMKNLKSQCSTYVSFDPFNVTFHEDKMAADNVKLRSNKFHLTGSCTGTCITVRNQWFFLIV
ncbi:uncharacterized protein LOC134235223 [Saccostrea cucullata]|uniref:uncharacterized protein LOC134232053 n=1 Tax=Saccostrea cuccullata TaxID=36930 RepID=UPI002ED398B3